MVKIAVINGPEEKQVRSAGSKRRIIENGLCDITTDLTELYDIRE